MGYQGYNNGVKLLNDICSKCYSNDEHLGLRARSLNIDDFEFAMKSSKNLICRQSTIIWLEYEIGNQTINKSN